MNFYNVPVGFGMALMRNEKATNAYAMMTREQKNAILQKAHAARSQREMERIVSAIAAQSIM